MTLIAGSGCKEGVGEGISVTLVLTGKTFKTGGLFSYTLKNTIIFSVIIEKTRKGFII